MPAQCPPSRAVTTSPEIFPLIKTRPMAFCSLDFGPMEILPGGRFSLTEFETTDISYERSIHGHIHLTDI